MIRYQLRWLVPAVFAGMLAVVTPALAQMTESELVMRLNRLEGQVRQLTGMLELAVAVLQLLDHAGELAHLAFQSVQPHHQLGFGHLRARRRDRDHARKYRRHERTKKKSDHGRFRRLARHRIRIAASKL